MFHPHAEAARVRMFAKLGVRLIALLMFFLFLRDVSLVIALTMSPFLGPSVVSGFGAMGFLTPAVIQALPWLVGTVVLLIVERPLISWLVPVPRAGCVNCGYAMSKSQQVCPECGMKPEVEESTEQASRDQSGDSHR